MEPTPFAAKLLRVPSTLKGARLGSAHRYAIGRIKMAVDFNKVAKACEGRRFAGGVNELEEAHTALRARIEPHSSLPPEGDWGDPARVRPLALALRQILLHRAIHLFEGTLDAVQAANPYMMILGMRGAFETAAALGYLHQRLTSSEDGNLDLKRVDEDIVAQVLGSRHPSLPEAMPAKQVLSMLEYADKSVSRHIMGGSSTEHAMLRNCYDFLCEFAHPNFHSNMLSYDLDGSARRLTFRYDKGMTDEAFGTLGYLLLAASLHRDLHDAIDDVLPAVP